MQAVIMAGGKGTRLSSLTKNEIPKPMVEIKNKPLLMWQLEELKKYGITKITMVIGYLGEKIVEYFKDGKDLGFEIDYIIENKALGTAGSFYYLKEKIKDDYFILVFGDVFFNIDINRMEKFHKEKKSLATLFVHPNSHPYDSDLVDFNSDYRVEKFDSKNNIRNYYYDNMVNAGLYIVSKEILYKVLEPEKIDFEKDILTKMVENSENIYAYVSTEYVKDVGTPDRIEKMLFELEKGIISSKNLQNKQKAIFIDRDGTINKLNGFISKPEEFELEEDAISAISLINSSAYLAIVITNQPSVARGLCDIEDIDYIHKKMKTLLGEKGAFIDKIYFCPHHPDRGFEGENLLYKISCACRKPNTGMVDMAVKDFNIDLDKSFIIGDSTMDIELAKRLGIRSILVNTGYAGKDKKYNVEADMICENIKEAVEKILDMEE